MPFPNNIPIVRDSMSPEEKISVGLQQEAALKQHILKILLKEPSFHYDQIRKVAAELSINSGEFRGRHRLQIIDDLIAVYEIYIGKNVIHQHYDLDPYLFRRDSDE